MTISTTTSVLCTTLCYYFPAKNLKYLANTELQLTNLNPNQTIDAKSSSSTTLWDKHTVAHLGNKCPFSKRGVLQ